MGQRPKIGKKEAKNLEKLKANQPWTPRKTEQYVGAMGGPFKVRWYIHRNSFKNRANANTELAKYIWKLKDYCRAYSIKWRILGKAQSHNTDTKICILCSKETYYILFRPDLSTLNDRNEVSSKCPHRISKLISNN